MQTRHQLLFSVLLAFPLFTLAYNPTVNVVESAYQPKVVNSIEMQSEFLGELTGDPHLYAFSLGRPTKLIVSLSRLASDEDWPLALLVVKDNDHLGLEEVFRQASTEMNWQTKKDRALNLAFDNSTPATIELPAGNYKLEVSTLDNRGWYVLRFGDDTGSQGYFSTLRSLKIYQNFFGGSIFAWLGSSYVYYPLCAILVLAAFIFYRTRRKNLNKKSD